MQDVICQSRLRASTIGARTINASPAIRGKARPDNSLSTDAPSGHGKHRTTSQVSTATLQTAQRDDFGPRDDTFMLPAVEPAHPPIGTSTAVLVQPTDSHLISSKASVSTSSSNATSNINSKKARSFQSGAAGISALCASPTASTQQTSPEPGTPVSQQHVGGNSGDSSCSSSTTTTSMSRKHVTFAPGPLVPEDSKAQLSPDGHPATEGAKAMPVRRLPATFALDLTKGNVLMLEHLLGQDCSMSITRLKR